MGGVREDHGQWWGAGKSQRDRLERVHAVILKRTVIA